ncbi:MAG: C40 family peptidase [Leifsonia sp.]
MTMVDIAARVDTIRTMIDDLRAPTVTTDATSAAGFDSELTRVTGATSAVPTGGATGSDVVAAAEKYLGVPYVFGGEDSSGMDCSGLVQRVYADLGIDLPRRVTQQMTQGTEVGSLAEAQPGDLIVTGGGDHILIYAGDGMVIHAPYEGRTVSKVAAYMGDDEITTIRRIIPTAAAPTAPAAAASSDLMTAALRSLLTGSRS